jgi:hypothetical protein
MAQTHYTLMEKDFDSEMSNAWKIVDDAPEFDTANAAAEWLKAKGVEYLDNYRAILNWTD